MHGVNGMPALSKLGVTTQEVRPEIQALRSVVVQEKWR